MQLLDDDMDELFRNAASQYPLKTDGADWDAVMRRLPQPDDKRASSFNKLIGSKWLKWLWGSSIVLLILFAGLSELNVGVLTPDKGSSTPVANSTIQERTPVSADKLLENDLSKNKVAEDKVSADKLLRTDLSKNRVVEEKVSADKLLKTDLSKNKVAEDKVSADKLLENKLSKNKVAENKLADNKKKPVINPNSIMLKESNHTTVAESMHVLPIEDVKEKEISASLVSSGNIPLRLDTTVTPVKIKVPVQKGLYVGIIGSPDFSTVKGQKITNVGYNAGVIAGYRISRRLAIETGVLFERKYYYSEGRYLDTKKINPPSSMKIINVDGWCKMIEIPLNIRYVFSIKEKSNWYVNAGISSYIMSKESYDYKYEMYNTISTKNWSYDNATRNWFSIIHAGVGYEHRVGAIGTLRVEPYLMIPAGGVGIGNLPLTSVGLNIGITRPIRF